MPLRFVASQRKKRAHESQNYMDFPQQNQSFDAGVIPFSRNPDPHVAKGLKKLLKKPERSSGFFFILYWTKYPMLRFLRWTE